MIAVQQGRVRVNYRAVRPSVDETLRAGQKMLVAWTGQATRGEEAASAVAAWRRNQLIAEDVPMHEVIDQLRPYYGGKIIVTNATLDDRNVTGVYNLSDPVGALRGIAKAHDATVYQITPWLLVVSGG
jgi:transmembrane sensor